ncbi:MAG: acetyl-CoA carboxylase biotin carboxylase subunit [Alphaproteobacteria bacterium]|nr:acetyl-CoA carboxylase biotin carboxylase subunit [Alphaproteobacteria bacterium]
MSFTKILIANRGEIAVRIARAARELGYRSVAVYSDADAAALHVEAADEAVRIGPPPVAESYLSIKAIVEAARQTGADAVHPGYGFLAENADFAKACVKASLTFIGPSAKAIALMGDKAKAKARMEKAGVPTVPGHLGDDQSPAALAKAAKAVGFPLMVKAAAGGGGRGMRVVEDAKDFKAALKSAQSEAKGAFGDDRVLLERLITGARHVEIQVIADAHGNAIHLGERDCSVQRRHQKVIEEAPSPAVDDELRAEMGAAAVAAAQAIDYQGAGTVEFLLGADGAFHFLEMNTRLQVEHPVTEMVTDLDIVALQIQIAAGEELPIDQDDVMLEGHAIEVRLYAEDPAAGFLPAAGRIAAWTPPADAFVRVDHGIKAGQEVTPFYDPMIAKVIAWGETRNVARRRLMGALEETVLLGLPTNRRFLIDVLGHDTFAAGEATTDFLETDFVGDTLEARPASSTMLALAALLLAGYDGKPVWGRRFIPVIPIILQVGAERIEAGIRVAETGPHCVELNGETVELRVLDRDGARLRFESEGRVRGALAYVEGNEVHLELDGVSATIRELPAYAGALGAEAGDGVIRAPLTGKVLRAPRKAGDRVAAGDVLFIVEAMKMEHEVRAPQDGVIAECLIAEGEQVPIDQVMLRIEASE